MGMGLDQVLAELKQIGSGGAVGVTIVTNQDNGIASYASGSLRYFPGTQVGPIFRGERLSTSGGAPLKYYFSDRMLDIDPPPPPGSFGNTPRQPFSANATDKLGMSLSRGGTAGLFLGPVARFTLLSWDNVAFNVAFEEKGNLLVGVGPPVGANTQQAVYLVSFGGIFRPPH